MGSSQITNILNIRNEAPERIKIIAASTPSGKREDYYKWCTGASKSYHARKEDVDNLSFTNYKIQSASDIGVKGNGWVEIWAPSIVNPELRKINTDTGQTYLKDLKDILTETMYDREVLALFGDEEGGVYKKELIEFAIQEGRRSKHKYVDLKNAEEVKQFNKGRRGPLILSIDWDKVIEFNMSYILESPIVK